MLEQVCTYIHNFFERHPVSGTRMVTAGTFSIEGGGIDLSALCLLSGQRFRIKGSALNDGVYTWGDTIMDDDNSAAASLTDETFTGEIWAMYPPKAVIALAAEIAAWVDQYGAAANSPYASESFGGYSYSKATGSANTAGGASLGTWQGVFANRLNAWRKVAE